MIKQVSINRFEGNGIIEKIEGNGWDIDAERIELNGINARIIENLENRIVSLDGPAVEDLFKSLRDLLKENSGLRETIEEQDACINRLEHSLKERGAVIKVLQFDKDHYKESCEILERSIEEKKDHINMLDKLLGDKDAEIDRLNDKLEKYTIKEISSIIRHNCELVEKCDELTDKCRVLENELKLADKWNPIKDFIHEATGEDFDFAVKTFLNFIPDYEVTVSVSRQEDDDNG